MKFEKKNELKIENEEIYYSEAKIVNVEISGKELDEYLLELISENENLSLMFSKEIKTSDDRLDVIDHFLPDERVAKENLNTYINNSQNEHKTFYSFLAEGLMGLVYRDILGVKPCHALISEESTHEDTHTGVDGVLYCSEKEVIIFGEAKFYSAFSSGMRSVADTFQANIKNKMNSFMRKLKANSETKILIMKLLKKNKITEINTRDIAKLDIIFGGFVLHTNDKNEYVEEDYKRINLSINEVKDNIKNEIGSVGEYKIYMFHLPINEKKELIEKIMVMFYEEVGDYE